MRDNLIPTSLPVSAKPHAPICFAPGTHHAGSLCRGDQRSSELASANHPRVPVSDYLIAAAAAERGFGVLHYDHHYDTLAGALGFESVWIAPPGTI